MSEDQNSGQRDLGETWAAILGELAASNATIFPSIPYFDESAHVYFPGNDQESWHAFLEVAGRVKPPVIYVRGERFADTSGHDPHLAIRPQHVELSEHYPGRVGMVGSIELAFSLGGVLHYWTYETDWWAQIEDAAAEREADLLSADDDPTFHGGSFGWYSPEGQRHLQDALGADFLEALVDRIARLPAFLTARSSYERQRLLDEGLDDTLTAWHNSKPDDELADDRRQAVQYVMHTAAERLPQVRTELVASLRADLPTLIAELVASPEYQAARMADQRRRRIREFVIKKLGFPSADLADELYFKAPKPAARSTRPTLPPT
jgi:hypothetical protein